MEQPSLAKTIELVDRAFKDYRDKDVKWTSLTDSDMLFRNLCIEIMNGVAKEYQHLKIGAQKAPQFAAWAARNLLELRIIARFVVKSKENAYRFINDMYPDGIELFEAVVRIQERVKTQEGIEVDSTPARQTLSNLQAEKLKRGLTHTDGHLEMLELAKHVGLRGEYVDVNKICSKLVHRTAFSVLVFESKDELAYIGPLMFHFGVQYGLDAWGTLGEHIEKHGMNPA